MTEEQKKLGDFKQINQHSSLLPYFNLPSLPFPESGDLILGETKRLVLDLVYKRIRAGSIAKQLKISKPATTQHLNELRNLGLVKKGMNNEGSFGDPFIITEKGMNFLENKLGFAIKTTRVVKTSPHSKLGFVKIGKDDINGHAFMFTLSIPKELLGWWKSREKILAEKKIESKPLNIFGGGQGIILDGKKIHLTSKSIIIFESASYVRKLAKESKSTAIYYFQKFIKKLERTFDKELKERGRYRFRVSRQHYALIQNSLAKQYNSEHKKLEVYNGKGRLIYLIDNSPTEANLRGENHFEAVNPETSDKDIDPAQKFFKSLDENPITTTEIKNNHQELVELIHKGSELQIGQMQVVHQIEQNLLKLTKVVYDIGRKE